MLGISVAIIFSLICIAYLIKRPRQNKSSSINDYFSALKFWDFTRIISIFFLSFMGVTFFPAVFDSMQKYNTPFRYNDFLPQQHGFDFILTTQFSFIFFINFIAVVVYKWFIAPKVIECPECERPIPLWSTWRCSLKHVNENRMILSKCKQCGVKLTSIKCPHCTRQIQFDKDYN
jgi:hypothetical protein